ncbi:conserved Plasmodium protein, unknown function [Plasmodium ovale wallikeri]|uniref:Radial spoke head protein 9 homolog n=1 Tax=Plasmodium ovale wallikeri TaxID=864142 RepID=A0A1A8ZX65_PLAOA|nr:conserved Plasmodium protein, unknown function [Plasmodium ovale wallikeri]
MISSKNLQFHLENLVESNRCLNEEEKLGLLYGMTNLEDKVNEEIYLWGKIEGIQNDYFITYYFNQNTFFPEKKFYYCNDDYEFHPIVKGNDTMIEKIDKRMPFTLFNGIPNSFYYKSGKSKRGKSNKKGGDQVEGSDEEESDIDGSDIDGSDIDGSDIDGSDIDGSDMNGSDMNGSDVDENGSIKGEEEGDEDESSDSEVNDIERRKGKKEKREDIKNGNDENERKLKNKQQKEKKYEKPNDITEIERLSYVVRKIDEEAFIVPYNSVKITNNLEMKFTNFTGLNIIDALKLTSWVHFRYPKNLTYDKIKNYNNFFLNNFLDTIKNDIPSNIWNIKVNKELSKIFILNYLHPGYIFYHIVNTPFHASIYIGNGIPFAIIFPFILKKKKKKKKKKKELFHVLYYK